MNAFSLYEFCENCFNTSETKDDGTSPCLMIT